MRWQFLKLTLTLVTLVFCCVSAAHAQTTWTGAAGDDNWFNANNWDTGVAPNSATIDVVIGSPSPTVVNGNVSINSLSIGPNGVLNQNSSLNMNFTGVATTTLDNQGLINVGNNCDFQLSEMVLNSGNIIVTSVGNLSDLEVTAAGATLLGNGAITLANHSNSRIVGVGNPLLTIVDQTINGLGQLGANTISMDNQANGLVDANELGNSLTIDPNASGGMTNSGTLQASNGGTLILTGSGGGGFDNTGGIIQAMADSTVALVGSVSINGGTLQTAGNGLIAMPTSQNAFLQDLTNNATIQINNNSDFGIAGIINNQGAINVISVGNQTDVEVQASGATVTGGGTIELSGNTNARVMGITGALLNIEDQLIRGFGQIGANLLSIDNQTMGIIRADAPTLSLTVDPASSGMTNTGTLQATDSGLLVLSGNGGGTINNAGGVIEAQNGSTVSLVSGVVVTGGEIRTTGTGQVMMPVNQNAFLSDLTLNGDIEISNNSDFGLEGTIENLQTITLASIGNLTDIEVQASGLTLTGGGVVNMVGSNNARIVGLEDANLIIDDQTVQGRGQIGGNSISIVNQPGGVIDANDPGNNLTIDPNAGGFENNGILRASDGGILVLSGDTGGFDNTNGLIEAQADSAVAILGSVVVSGGILGTTGNGVIAVPINQNGFVDQVTVNGTLVANNNSDLGISGVIQNNAEVIVDSIGNLTDIEVQSGGATIAGDGDIVLRGHPNARIAGSGDIVIQDGTLRGVGQVLVNSTFDGATISPGSSIGTLTFQSATSFLNQTRIEMELNSATATPGIDSDLVSVNSTLNLTGVLPQGVVVELVTLDPMGDSGMLADFEPSENYVYTVAVADEITGFSPSVVQVDTSNFQNSFDGVFSVTTGPIGNDEALYVKYGRFALGDVNQDGSVNLLDVSPFIDAISTGGTMFEADINCDGQVNLLDVDPFIVLLGG